jgi:hypothetical protein
MYRDQKLWNALTSILHDFVGDRDWDEMRIYESYNEGKIYTFRFVGMLDVVKRAMKNLKSSQAKKKGIKVEKLAYNYDGDRGNFAVRVPLSLAESAYEETPMSKAKVIAKLVEAGHEDLAEQMLQETTAAPLPKIKLNMHIGGGHPDMPFAGTFSATAQSLQKAEKFGKPELVRMLAEEFSTTGGGGDLPEAAVKKVLNAYPKAVLDVLWSGTFGGVG